MASGLRFGIAGCGHAARVHAGRLLALPGLTIVGCADPNIEHARALALTVGGDVPAFTDHRELLRQTTPDALAIFLPHLGHYRAAMDALQAGCHLFIEKPLSTSPQEATDIVNLARARRAEGGRRHQYRLLPSLIEARRRVAAGAIGPVRLVTAVMAAPWLAAHGGLEDTWRLDPKTTGAGILADAGDHLLDALLWVSGGPAVEVAAFQSRQPSGLDVVDAAALRLAGGAPATLAIAAVTPAFLFEIRLLGERGALRATDAGLWAASGDSAEEAVELPVQARSIDADFVAALSDGTPPACPAEEALETVRLLEAIARSAATGQTVRLA